MKRILKAIGYSCEGLKAAFGSEPAFRLEVALFAIMGPIALLLHVTPAERALLIASLFLALIIELINSAIEAAINRVSTKIHPLSKRAKDIGSAAVFVTLLNAGAIWLIILCQ